MESGENPEQAYPYCNVDEGNNDYSGHWVEEPGKALLEDDAKSGYRFAKTGLWEEAQGIFLSLESFVFRYSPMVFARTLEIE